MAQDITPLRQQYLDIKKQYPDAILFFRLGDFYETFDDDARRASEALDIVLTSRPVAKGVRVPMAGIPFHAADNYLGRLIEKGYRVAIAEQVGDQPDKGLFPREVVRVVTPGTVVEPGLLSAGENNYLAAVCLQENRAGIAYLDITTGEFTGTQLELEEGLNAVRTELTRINPAETLRSEAQELPNGFPGTLTAVPGWYFEPGRAEELLKGVFGVGSLDGFGLKSMPLTTRAAGALLKYLQETNQNALSSLKSFGTYSLGDFMVLDAETRRNLELAETLRDGKSEGSLLWVLDQTKTPMGKRMLRQWVNKPLLNPAAISTRLDMVETFYRDGVLRNELTHLLHEFHDLERLVNRACTNSIRPPELVSLREDLNLLPKLRALLPQVPALAEVLAGLHEHQDIQNLLEEAIADEPPATLANIGIIKPGFSDELDAIVSSSKHAREWIGSLEAEERKRTGIKTLRVGFNKVFGYYIEISRGSAENAPAEYLRKQTLVNAERFITPELKEYESLVLNAEAQIHEVELRVFRSVCQRVASSAAPLLETARALAQLDCVLSLASAAALNNYVRPVVRAEKGLKIYGGRHPVVERLRTGERFIANDAVFEDGEIVRVITGPNMSGKSTFLRQVVLIVLMAQLGSFVPAESAEIGLVDRIFTRIGAQDAIHAGQSTFMVEMIEAANILNNASPRSLLILDEIGRGTSTYDGLSIAWAIIEYLHSHPRLKPFTLFATHYHELTELAEMLPGVRNYNVAVTESEGRVVFLHKIVPGGADRSYGIHVAQLAGLPAPVIQRANELLKQLESTAGKTLPDQAADTSQLRLFPENNPLIDAFRKVDLNSLSPIQALNLLYEWRRNFFPEE
ncbi:MAG TPA: DNA mismatch repair protein MutS [Anaerolineaceae bacterium]|jgi:DNA mismatch repair protein MutS|nr:DNA mismatch repair protein MutS [Anaerolineaceae bacterium]HPL42862.1 DNA mismatch repair protein MutS [Anaerolineaceae bacterium]HPY33896.1 DNA mismatch repair protein MutS [Anaerolineaceae bacterium]